jgi:hypothetical protein
LALDGCSVKVLDPLKTLASMLAVLLAYLALPALASAATYVVNETGNVAPDAGCTAPPEVNECDLWEAIDLSNASPVVVDAINFSVAEVSIETSALPAITEPVNIDGADEDGRPGVALDGETEGFFTNGLLVSGNGVEIRGLAIHHFQNAITFAGSQGRVCGSYLGTDLTGDVAEETEVGVRVTTAGVDNEIGAECPADQGNVISGNEWLGILDSGTRTQIARNLIGMDAFGEALPNGEEPAASEPSGGILAEGDETLIGGVGVGSGLSNTIAYNEGQFGFGGGVVVDSTSVSIRGNSIFASVQEGIYFRFDGLAEPAPELGVVTSAEGGSTVVAGSIEAGANQEFGIDIFANEACDAITNAGEGETYLGSATVKTDATGVGAFEASVPVQPQGTVLTATATQASSGSTSEFSGCVVAPQPTPKPPPPPGSPPPIQPIVSLEPVNGETLAVEPVSGVIYVKLPGKAKQVKLTEGMLIPVGAVVDATKGKVTLTSVNKAGEAQTAIFYGGKFLVAQRDGSGLVTLKLRGGNFSNCGKAKGSTATASARSGRRLWGSGKGKFRTEGNNGSATVRGTVWLTEDRCAGTFFKVKQGVVTVRDFAANETFPLGKGKSYLAQP